MFIRLRIKLSTMLGSFSVTERFHSLALAAVLLNSFSSTTGLISVPVWEQQVTQEKIRTDCSARFKREVHRHRSINGQVHLPSPCTNNLISSPCWRNGPSGLRDPGTAKGEPVMIRVPALSVAPFVNSWTMSRCRRRPSSVQQCASMPLRM
jgi:hypothetical protein